MVVIMEERSSDRTSERSWKIFGGSVPKAEIQYLGQIIIIYIVIITCIFNLSINSENKDNGVWTALLSSCLGYMLPNPSMNNRNNHRDG